MPAIGYNESNLVECKGTFLSEDTDVFVISPNRAKLFEDATFFVIIFTYLRDHSFKTLANFYKFLTPTPLPSAFSTIRRQIWQIFDPSPHTTCRRLKWMVPKVKIQVQGDLEYSAS